MLVGGIIYMENEEDIIYLEDVEKPQIIYCKHAEIKALEVHENEEDKVHPLLDSSKHPVFLIYPMIDDELTVTGFKAKLELPVGKLHKKERP